MRIALDAGWYKGEKWRLLSFEAFTWLPKIRALVLFDIGFLKFKIGAVVDY